MCVHLHFHPYKLAVERQLNVTDYPKQLGFAQEKAYSLNDIGYEWQSSLSPSEQQVWF